MSPVLVLGVWLGGSVAIAVLGVWLYGRERRSARRRDGMSLHAVEASLRPRGGHVAPSPIEAPAPRSTNGNGGS
jgi:hypothetical protein